MSTPRIVICQICKEPFGAHKLANNVLICRKPECRHEANLRSQRAWKAGLKEKGLSPWARVGADEPLPAPKGEKKIIPCLRCRRSFESDGPHNRLCPICGGYADRLEGYATPCGMGTR